jgi:D-alanyl-lipoteichoic acid acyltransferase DltB (MBOAT superfamily)
MSNSAMFKAINREKSAWYLKWAASLSLVLGMSVRASGIPELAIYDLSFSFVGICGWLTVSLIWNDRALILLNAVGFLILLSGLIKYFFVGV